MKIAIVQMTDSPCVRMRKVAAELSDNDLLYIGCKRSKDLPESKEIKIILIPPRIKRRSYLKILFAPLWIVFASFYLRCNREINFVYAADFEAGLSAFLSGKKYAYDILDTYADRYRMPKALRQLLRHAESFVFNNAEIRVHVDHIRATTILSEKSYHVVQNVPRMADLLNTKQTNKEFDIIASGNLDSNRGVDQLLQAMKTVINAKCALVGGVSDQLSAQISERINCQYFGYKSSIAALQLTRCSKAVFAAYDPAKEINKLACPNKFYDAILNGIPVIMNRGLALSTFISDEGLGWVYDWGDIEGLKKIIYEIHDGSDNYYAHIDRVEKLSSEIVLWSDQFLPVREKIMIFMGDNV